jgi:hypothetical protein
VKTTVQELLESFNALPEADKQRAAVDTLRQVLAAAVGDVPESTLAEAADLLRCAALALQRDRQVEEKDGVAYYRGGRPFEELELPPELPAEADDYDWAMEDPQVRQTYGGLVVAVWRRKVWGAGRNHRAALEQAQKTPDCPPTDELVFVVVPGPMPGACAGKH